METIDALEKLPVVADSGLSARLGTGTLNDFRFLRLFWEVSPSQTYFGYRIQQSEINVDSRWHLYAKGGDFARYYFGHHLVLNWLGNGKELKAWIPQVYGGGPWSRNIRNTDFYHRPGITWPRRTNKGFCARALGSGAIFADKGPTAFDDGDDLNRLSALLGIMNSRAFQFLLEFRTVGGSWEVGAVQRTPLPPIPESIIEEVSSITNRCYDICRSVVAGDETDVNFFPWWLSTRETFAETLLSTQRIVWDAETDLLHKNSEIESIVTTLYPQELMKDDLLDDQPDYLTGQEFVKSITTRDRYAKRTVSWLLGASLGRWDARCVTEPGAHSQLRTAFAPVPSQPPGALVKENGLPAISGEIVSLEWLRARADAISMPDQGSVSFPTTSDADYPVRVNWDGLLVDDPDHEDDVTRNIREVLTVIWQDSAVAVEQGVNEALNIWDLTEYVRKSTGFFADHLALYSKSRRHAPIYWPLSTASGSYTIWLYYPRLTSDTIYTAVNRYLAPKITAVHRGISELEQHLGDAGGRETTELQSRLEKHQAFRAELDNMRTELLRIADLPYTPNLDDGVIINAAPFHRLFRLSKWAKATRECWEKLERGDCDWAHLAYAIWPDRVRDVCRRDRSIAIAHDLEDLCVPSEKVKPAARKKNMQRLLIEDEA